MYLSVRSGSVHLPSPPLGGRWEVEVGEVGGGKGEVGMEVGGGKVGVGGKVGGRGEGGVRGWEREGRGGVRREGFGSVWCGSVRCDTR